MFFRPFGHVAVDDALGQAFDDRRLADAWFADQHRIVLGAPREDLHGAADFLVAPDHRIDLTVGCRLSQVTGIFLERLVLIFRRCGIRYPSLAQLVDGRIQALRVHAGRGKRVRGPGVL